MLPCILRWHWFVDTTPSPWPQAAGAVPDSQRGMFCRADADEELFQKDKLSLTGYRWPSEKWNLPAEAAFISWRGSAGTRLPYPQPARMSLRFQHHITDCPNEFFWRAGAHTYLLQGVRAGRLGHGTKLAWGLHSAFRVGKECLRRERGCQTHQDWMPCPHRPSSGLPGLPSLTSRQWVLRKGQEVLQGTPSQTPTGVHCVKDKIISTSCCLLTNFLSCAKLHARHFVRLAPCDCPWGVLPSHLRDEKIQGSVQLSSLRLPRWH